MLEKIFSNKKDIQGKCIVFYCFNYDRNLKKELFYFLIDYFKQRLKIDFKYAGFYNEKYDDNYGKIESIKSRIIKEKWQEIVNITFDDEDIRGAKRKVGVEFNITRPIQITIVLAKEYESFDIADFVRKLYSFYKTIYGFSYLTRMDQWATAYANGDWQHVGKSIDVTRLSKDILIKWSKDCEKIQNGYIRDVYRENILNKSQLEALVGDASLEEFIHNQKIGNLQLVDDEIFLWQLDDNQLNEARNYLYKTSILV